MTEIILGIFVIVVVGFYLFDLLQNRKREIWNLKTIGVVDFKGQTRNRTRTRWDKYVENFIDWEFVESILA